MIPLHVHSNYTLLKGAVCIQKLIDEAGKNHLYSLALTDTNGMYGLIQFAKAAVEKKIKPVLGCLIDQPDDESLYAILLAKNNSGYEDICKIITSRKLNDDFTLRSLLSRQLENLYIITPSIELLKEYGQRENVFAELIITKKNKNNAHHLYNYAKEHGIKLVGTNPVYFLKPEDYELHKAVSAIRLNKTLDNISEDEIVDKEFYFKNCSEVDKIFRNIPEAIKNSESIAENCNVDLHLHEYKFPSFHGDTESFSLLWQKCFEGLKKRYSPL